MVKSKINLNSKQKDKMFYGIILIIGLIVSGFIIADSFSSLRTPKLYDSEFRITIDNDFYVNNSGVIDYNYEIRHLITYTFLENEQTYQRCMDNPDYIPLAEFENKISSIYGTKTKNLKINEPILHIPVKEYGSLYRMELGIYEQESSGVPFCYYDNIQTYGNSFYSEIYRMNTTIQIINQNSDVDIVIHGIQYPTFKVNMSVDGVNYLFGLRTPFNFPSF